ncbi:MAG: C_GCAxxG_C_C family protein [Spirochaetes bacterium]|nr:C_GCAxxG_C_C family protein [Spirochaetota bacterium]
MNNPEKAVSNFNNGLNCAQAILKAYGPSCGLEENLCVRIAAPLGGGIGHLQEICGAVSGAIMVIGLKFGEGSEDRGKRARINDLVQDFVREFTSRNRSHLCRDLLGFDISTPDGLAEARKKGIFGGCAEYVRIAAEILEKML